MHSLGRTPADGLGRKIDSAGMQEWYVKVLVAFLKEEKHIEGKQRPYLRYCIGKMFAIGPKTEQGHEKTVQWLSKAMAANHKYAQYPLVGLYYWGQGEEQNYKQTHNLYRCSAEQGNPYADYELAKMHRGGIGTQKDIGQAETYFQNTFLEFFSLKADSHDDRLQYHLGQMLHTGTDTRKDNTAAIHH